MKIGNVEVKVSFIAIAVFGLFTILLIIYIRTIPNSVHQSLNVFLNAILLTFPTLVLGNASMIS